MATRQTRLITKNSIIPSQTLPTTSLLGEAVVNLGDGILFFSGGTAGSPTWVNSDNPTSGYFEVGSNLYDLKLRNKIQEYQGISNLAGKFLSGTTSGFTLANIADIQGVDSKVTAFTYTDNVISLDQDNNGSDFSVHIDTMTGLTISGTLDVTTITGVNSLSATTVTGIDINGTTVNATDLYLDGTIKEYGGLTDLTGKFLSGTTDGFALANIADIEGVDSYVTGFTFNSSTNTFSLGQNNAGSNFDVVLQTVSGLTVTNDLAVGGDTVINGNLTVLGESLSAFTSELYVEDANIEINYNPTGSTIATSVNAGLTVQDGNGIAAGDVNLNIVRLQNLTGLTATNIPDVSEYTGPNGFNNRGWITQMNDIIIRSSDTSDDGTAGDITGVRVLTEFDILYGGTY